MHQWCSHVAGRRGVTRAAIDPHASGPPRDFAIVLDLDPGDGPWAHLVEVAAAVRTLLDALKLESFVKTSGNGAGCTWSCRLRRVRRTTRRPLSPSVWLLP